MRHPTGILAILLTVSTIAWGSSHGQQIPEPFRDAPAVVLEEHNEWQIVPGKKGDFRFKRRILIQNPEGFHKADQGIIYAASESHITEFSARTILPDGSVVEVPDDLKHDELVYQVGEYQVRSLRFTFPAVTVGSIIEWNYRLLENAPKFTREWSAQDDIPVLHTLFHVRAKRQDWQLITEALPTVDVSSWCNATDVSDKKFVGLEMECFAVPAFEHERLAPPAQDLRASFEIRWGPMQFHQDYWNHVSSGLKGNVEKFLKKGRNTARLARDLVRPEMSQAERFDLISDYVRRNITVRSSSYAPPLLHELTRNESVDETLANSGGTPPEVVLLTLAMMQEAGMRVQLLAVKNRTQGRFSFDRFDSVDHLLLRVRVGSEWRTLDPSCHYCAAGVVDWRYASLDAVGINVATMEAKPVESGIVPARYNSQSQVETIVVEPDGLLSGSGEVTWNGQLDVNMRRQWGPMSDSARVEDFLDLLTGVIEDANAEISDPEAVFEVLTAQYDYRRRDLPPLPDGRLIVRPLDVISDHVPVPLDEERQSPIWLPYRFTVKIQTTFQLPEGYRVVNLDTRGEVITGPGMDFRQIWNEGDEPDSLVWIGMLTILGDRIEVEDYDAAQRFAREVRYALRRGVVLLGGADLIAEDVR